MGITALVCYHGYWWLLVNSYRYQLNDIATSVEPEEDTKGKVLRKEDIYHIEVESSPTRRPSDANSHYTVVVELNS